jgi:hypothetical protein
MDWYHTHFFSLTLILINNVHCSACLDNYRSLLKPHSTLNSLDIAGGGGLGMFKLYPAEQKLKFVVTIDGISDVSNAYIYTHANDGTKHKHSHRKILYNFYSLYRPQVSDQGIWFICEIN